MTEKLEAKIVGEVRFQNRILPVYGDLDEPLFKGSDVADLVDYGEGNIWNLVRLCEDDEHLILPAVVAGQRRKTTFVTETGLYNILSQSRKPLARAWRRVIHEELIALRKSQGKNVAEKFQEWDHKADNIYFDEERGCLMRSVTVQGGDVEQVPYKEDD
jgi:prophage antirepressor-like protein